MPEGGFQSLEHKIAWLEGMVECLVVKLVPMLVNATNQGPVVTIPTHYVQAMAKTMNEAQPELHALEAWRRKSETENGLTFDTEYTDTLKRFSALEIPE